MMCFIRSTNYYYKDNGGHASALNLGFEKSSGEIICFLDADDRFKEDKIKNLDQYYTRHGCKALFHNAELFGQSIKTGQSLYRDECLDGLERIEDKLYRLTLDRIESAFYYLVILSAQSYRREICEKLFPIPSIYTNYTDWPLRNLALLYTDIHYCNESLLLYRQHSSSHTRITGKDLEQKKLRITLLDHLTNELRVRDTIGQASRLIQLQEDHMHLAKYTLAKAMGHKFLALKHVLYSNPYPHVSFVYRLIRRWDLMLSVVLPAVIYRFMKVMYKTLGLRELL